MREELERDTVSDLEEVWMTLVEWADKVFDLGHEGPADGEEAGGWRYSVTG